MLIIDSKKVPICFFFFSSFVVKGFHCVISDLTEANVFDLTEANVFDLTEANVFDLTEANVFDLTEANLFYFTLSSSSSSIIICQGLKPIAYMCKQSDHLKYLSYVLYSHILPITVQPYFTHHCLSVPHLCINNVH